MIYLYLSKNTIEVLATKKTLFNQYQSFVFKKNYETDLLEEGKIANVDVVASAIKEVAVYLNEKKIVDKEIFLILPHNSFLFQRVTVPPDVAKTAIDAFLKDKIQANLRISLDDYQYTFTTKKINEEVAVNLYAYSQEQLEKLVSVFNLIHLKLVNLLPDVVSYYALFEKALSLTKKENIIYLKYDPDFYHAYLYDSFGYLNEASWKLPVTDQGEKIIREKVLEYEAKKIKFQRLILAGINANKVRQDFFTKTVGVWTNPLIKIVDNFYHSYLKMLPLENNQLFPVLEYDTVLGAFIFSIDNRYYSFLKRKPLLKKEEIAKKINLPTKEIGFFIASFILAFFVLSIINNIHLNFPKLGSISLSKPSPTPLPTNKPTLSPTPTINLSAVKVKILNGSGVVGKAAEVKEILRDLGYEQIVTGNADNFDYKITEIQVKKSKVYLGDKIKKDLSGYTNSFKLDFLDEKENVDLLIIIGSDFK